MKTLLHFIKTTMIGGLLFLIPLVLVLAGSSPQAQKTGS